MALKRIPFLSISFQPDARLEDTIKLAIKPALAEALQVSEGELDRLVVSDATIQVSEAGAHLPEISESVLQAIRDSAFVICDTTNNRPNCYLELGYALGYGKQVFLLHRQDSPPPEFNIRNRPIIFYTGALELRQKLLSALRSSGWYGDSQPASELASFFRRCGLPVFPLEGDGHYEYRASTPGGSTVTVNLQSRRFSPPPPWDARFQDISTQQLDRARLRGELPFNGALVRLSNFHPVHDEGRRVRYLRLDVEPTDYYTFTATHFGLDLLPDAQKRQVWEHEQQNFGDLRNSWLANPLTVDIAVVAQHGGREWILIQERNKVFHHKGRYHGSCAGMMSLSRDRGSLGIDVFAAARHELGEELGMVVSETDLALLGLVRETEHAEVGLIFEVQVTKNPDELLNPAPDGFETKRVYSCELDPEHVADFIQAKGGLPAFSGLGLATIIFSLLKRFPVTRIESALR
jgi:hypothetical protein